jgi:hypothetical protein
MQKDGQVSIYSQQLLFGNKMQMLWLNIAVFSALALPASAAEPVSLALTPTASASCEQFSTNDQIRWAPDSNNSLISTSIKRAPYTNPRRQTGELITAQTRLLNDVEWKSVTNGDELAFLQITLSAQQKPIVQWVFNNTCEIVQQRELSYENGSPESLKIINPANNRVQKTEPLNPPLPIGLPQQTSPNVDVRVALVDSGVNYLIPEIYNNLKTDQHGKLIGYDYWDNDHLPFDAHFSGSDFHVTRHGTGIASLLIREAPFVTLIPYRYPRPDMSRMRDLIEHADAFDVSIIGLPLGSNKADQWEVFAEAAAAHPHILFIASAGNNGRNIDAQPVYPAALDIDNLLVVTSADDFVMPAERVNWGRANVDYMLPAENQAIINFDGIQTRASGSSYAVPRAVALAAKLKLAHPEWQATQIIKEFARRFADGSSVRYVGGGYIADPTLNDAAAIELTTVQTFSLQAESEEVEQAPSFLPMNVYVLDSNWSNESIQTTLQTAGNILKQCNIEFANVTISQLNVPDYLKDLATGPSKTLISSLQNKDEQNALKVFFARDTRMQTQFDGEAFGRGNTRRRPWLQNSVWLMKGIQDSGVALAHELFHVLSNSGEHTSLPNNLMQTRTSPSQVELLPEQCEVALDYASNNALIFD